MPRFKFSNKNILIISPEPWDFIKVSKHHYAQTLAAKKNTVYFLNPPGKDVKHIACKKVAENLFVIDYKDPYKGVRFFPRPFRKYLNKRLYQKLQQVVKAEFDVVFLFENSRFYDLDFLHDNVLSIYFQVDEDQNFHPHIAARTAGVVMAINDIIRDILSKHRTPVFKLAHGFSGNFSDGALQAWSGEKVYRAPADRLKAYYVGNLDHNFSDSHLLVSLVRQAPGVDFVFIGPYSTTGTFYSGIKDCINVRFLGKVSADLIPRLLDEADVLFFAYREDFLSSSHKLMEYLASGKAIVTTTVKGYPEDPELFCCSGSAGQFVQLFNEVCNNIEEANSPGKMRKRIQYAMENTYAARIAQIEEIVNQLSANKNSNAAKESHHLPVQQAL